MARREVSAAWRAGNPDRRGAMSDEDFRLDNPMLVRWEFASEERLEKRNALYRRLTEGINAEEVLFDAVKEFAPTRVLDVGCGAGAMAERVRDELGAQVVADIC